MRQLLLCTLLLVPACAASEKLSASFEAEPLGPLSWAPDTDLGWARHEPPGPPAGDVLKIDPIDSVQITIGAPGELSSQSIRIAAPGIASPVSLRALPAGAPLRFGRVSLSFTARFEEPPNGLTDDVEWLLVASDSTDQILGGLLITKEVDGPVLSYGATDFYYTEPKHAVDPTRPFTLVVNIWPSERRLELTLRAGDTTVVSGESFRFPMNTASDVATLVFYGTEGALVLDDVQAWQD